MGPNCVLGVRNTYIVGKDSVAAMTGENASCPDPWEDPDSAEAIGKTVFWFGGVT